MCVKGKIEMTKDIYDWITLQTIMNKLNNLHL